MDYSCLVEVYTQLDSTTKRLEKTALLAAFLKDVLDKDLGSVMQLIEGKAFPDYDERKIGVATQIMVKAIAQASGSPLHKVEETWKKLGDLGLVAEKLIASKKQATLGRTDITTTKVLKNIQALAGTEGSGSVDRKIGLIVELLSSASGPEARYLTRMILEQTRIGLGAGTIRDALASAYFQGDETAKDAIQSAYDVTNDWGRVAIAAAHGRNALEKIELTIGVPIKVMLALKAESIAEALEYTGTPADVEYKYDGFRLQIHKDHGKITLFTRRLENVTVQFPDVVDAISKNVKGESFILDSEAVGFDPSSGKYLPFQMVSQRIRRKYRIEEMLEKFPVEVNLFDIISLNGKNLLNLPLHERKRILNSIVKPKERHVVIARSVSCSEPKEIEKLFKESIAAGNEGLMIKNVNAPYQPGARVGNMVKFKATMENLDLVIVGAEWGEGKRSEWLASYIVAFRDGSELVEIGKVGTGFKEKEEEGVSFAQLTEMLRPLITHEDVKIVRVKPRIVIEVAFEEIQRSPTYSSGYALRFPRLFRLRDDRGFKDISTRKDVERLFNSQKKIQKE